MAEAKAARQGAHRGQGLRDAGRRRRGVPLQRLSVGMFPAADRGVLFPSPRLAEGGTACASSRSTWRTSSRAEGDEPGHVGRGRPVLAAHAELNALLEKPRTGAGQGAHRRAARSSRPERSDTAAWPSCARSAAGSSGGHRRRRRGRRRRARRLGRLGRPDHRAGHRGRDRATRRGSSATSTPTSSAWSRPRTGSCSSTSPTPSSRTRPDAASCTRT